MLAQVRANARALGARLMKYGYKLVTDGTDNHLVLWDMRKEVSTQTASVLCSCHVCLLQGLGSLWLCVCVRARLHMPRSQQHWLAKWVHSAKRWQTV